MQNVCAKHCMYISAHRKAMNGKECASLPRVLSLRLLLTSPADPGAHPNPTICAAKP